LRLLLAACVLFQHNQDLAFGARLGSPLRPLEIGSLAVLAFFVISGIIVVAAAERFYIDAPGRFLSNRFVRIFPAYLTILLVSYLVLTPFAWNGSLMTHEGHPAGPGSQSLYNLVANALYALPVVNSLVEPSYSFLEIVWAVRTEFLFYCVVFAALLGAGMIGRSQAVVRLCEQRGLDQVGRFRAVLAALLGGAFVIYYINDLWPFFPFDSIRFVPTFALGTALCFALRGYRVAGWLSVPLFLLTLHEILHQPAVHPTAHFVRNLPGEAIVFTGMLAAILMLAKVRLVPDRLDRLCGDISYPVYVGHLLPVIVLASMGELAHPTFLWIIPSLVGTALIVFVVDRGIELPVAAIRARIRGTRLDPPGMTRSNGPAGSAGPAVPAAG
jgi:peptidoglycan/LPS O-acetylase OafA/YrhL